MDVALPVEGRVVKLFYKRAVCLRLSPLVRSMTFIKPGSSLRFRAGIGSRGFAHPRRERPLSPTPRRAVGTGTLASSGPRSERSRETFRSEAEACRGHPGVRRLSPVGRREIGRRRASTFQSRGGRASPHACPSERDGGRHQAALSLGGGPGADERDDPLRAPGHGHVHGERASPRDHRRGPHARDRSGGGCGEQLVFVRRVHRAPPRADPPAERGGDRDGISVRLRRGRREEDGRADRSEGEVRVGSDGGCHQQRPDRLRPTRRSVGYKPTVRAGGKDEDYTVPSDGNGGDGGGPAARTEAS